MPANWVMSKVTAAMWAREVSDRGIELYVAAIADKDGDDVVETTHRWVTLTGKCGHEPPHEPPMDW